jgi:hypothetical protein
MQMINNSLAEKSATFMSHIQTLTVKSSNDVTSQDEEDDPAYVNEGGGEHGMSPCGGLKSI